METPFHKPKTTSQSNHQIPLAKDAKPQNPIPPLSIELENGAQDPIGYMFHVVDEMNP